MSTNGWFYLNKNLKIAGRFLYKFCQCVSDMSRGKLINFGPSMSFSCCKRYPKGIKHDDKLFLVGTQYYVETFTSNIYLVHPVYDTK